MYVLMIFSLHAIDQAVLCVLARKSFSSGLASGV